MLDEPGLVNGGHPDCWWSSLPIVAARCGIKVVSLTGKGGAGKTGVTASTAVCAMEQGLNVVVLDLDPRGDLAAWSKLRRGRAPRMVSVDETNFSRVLQRLRNEDGIDLVLIDAPGEKGNRSDMAMLSSDLCLVAARPSFLDVRAANGFLTAASRLDRHAAVILTQCLHHPGRIEEARAIYVDHAIDTGPPIRFRVDHQDAIAGGLGVTEHNSHGAAADEIRALWDWLRVSLWMSEQDA